MNILKQAELQAHELIWPMSVDSAPASQPLVAQRCACSQALLTQDPGLTRQLTAALPAGVQLAVNATQAAGAQVQGPDAELSDEAIEKRSASMLLG
jgi:hypothetical protein